MINNYDYIIGILGSIVGYMFGKFDGFIYALITLCTIDYISGILAAGVKHELSSDIGFKGIAKKIMMFGLVGMAHVFDHELLGDTALLRDGVIFFYIANEGLSILENTVTIGLPVPDVLKEKLLGMKKS